MNVLIYRSLDVLLQQ